jgi:hypothetical protein
MDLGQHPTKLKRLGRHKSFSVLGEYLEFGDLFEGHPLGGVLKLTRFGGAPQAFIGGFSDVQDPSAVFT